ncbi:MAG: TonB-dependent receptor [Gammaproteobacteria bacterium]|nr:TonB-dependent receptor [Gammaproteobacteria bacterium]
MIYNKDGIKTLTGKRLSSLSLAIAALCAGTHAGAQSNTIESIFVTADRQEAEIGDTAASIFALDSDYIDEVRPVHIEEVLKSIPGVVINRGNGQESLLGIRSPVLTGAGSCGAFQTSQDGIPLRGTGFCNVNQLFESNFEQASSIEVVRGPGSVLFGVNALHGAINIISPALADEAGGEVSLDVGPHDYGRVNLGYNGVSDEHSFGVHFNGSTDGGYKDDSGFGQQKLNLAHRYSGDVSVTTVFAATNLNQETAGYVSGTDAYKDEALQKSNPNPEAFRDASSIRLHSRIEGQAGEATWMVTPYYRDVEMDFLMHFLPGTPLEQNGHTSLGVQTMYSANLSNDVSWIAGVDLEISDGYLRQTQDGGFGSFPAGRQYDFDVDTQLISPYAQFKYQPTEMDQFSLGLRYELLEYDYDNKMIDGNTAEDGSSCAASAFNPTGVCRYSRPSDRSDDFNNATFQLGWIHDFDDTRQTYVNVAHAFRAPQATELYRLQQNQTVADLDSEEIDSFEVGYRATTDAAVYSVAAYWMQKDNVIFQDSARNNVSGGETEHKGIELNSLFTLTDSLELSVVASYARHTYEANIAPLGVTVAIDGNDIDTAPKLTGNVQLSWQINPSNRASLEWVYMDKYYTEETNTRQYEGHDLTNLRYQYESGDNWYFAARITNLFDTDYAERADFNPFGGDRYFIGEPASLYLTVGMDF